MDEDQELIFSGPSHSNSFEHSFYPSQQQLAPLSFVPQAALLNAHASSSNTLFTPPPTSSIAPAAPGVKRARGQAAASTSHSAAVAEDELKPGRRVVRGVPGTDKRPARDSSVGAPTRRSSRLSRDTNGSSTGTTGTGPSSSSMSVSRSSNSRASSSTTTAPAGGKKRTKNGAGPSVLSDAGSDALSPTSHSHSSSPVPSSPGASSHHQPLPPPIDPAVQDAEDYVVGTLRSFGRAAVAAANYEGAKTIEALMQLPVEQQRSWRCLIGVGRAHFDMLNYDKVCAAPVDLETFSLTSPSHYRPRRRSHKPDKSRRICSTAWSSTRRCCGTCASRLRSRSSRRTSWRSPRARRRPGSQPATSSRTSRTTPPRSSASSAPRSSTRSASTRTRSPDTSASSSTSGSARSASFARRSGSTRGTTTPGASAPLFDMRGGDG